MQLSNVAAGPTTPGNKQSLFLATSTKQNSSLSGRAEVLKTPPYATSASSTGVIFSAENRNCLSKLVKA